MSNDKKTEAIINRFLVMDLGRVISPEVSLAATILSTGAREVNGIKFL